MNRQMSLVEIKNVNQNVSEFVKGCDEVGLISHQNLSLFTSIFEKSLETKGKVCEKNGCGFSFVKESKEDPERPLDDLFTDQVAHNPTAQYLTYLFYVYLNNALAKTKIGEYQYIFKGGTSYRSALISLYEKLEKTPEMKAFFTKYILDENSPDCIFKVSDFDSIVYLLFSNTPTDYLKRAEYVKQNILSCLVRFKQLLETDIIFKNYKKRLFEELATEWQSPIFREKLIKIVSELYPNEKIEPESVWIQLLDHANILIIDNPMNDKYGTVIDMTNSRIAYPRLPQKGYYTSRSPFYVSSNEILQYDTYLPSQDKPESYRFVLNRMKLNIVVHIGKRVIKSPAEFIDVAFPLYTDYGLQHYISSGFYKHLNALTPYELYKGTTTTIDFDADIKDIFRILLGKSEEEIDSNRLKVLIYSPYLLFDDLVATLLQKRYPWESQKLDKRIKRFLVMKFLYQIILLPSRPLTNSLRNSSTYISQMKTFFEHGNHSKNDERKVKFYQSLDKIHTQLAKVLSSIKINNQQRDSLKAFFIGN